MANKWFLLSFFSIEIVKNTLDRLTCQVLRCGILLRLTFDHFCHVLCFLSLWRRGRSKRQLWTLENLLLHFNSQFLHCVECSCKMYASWKRTCPHRTPTRISLRKLTRGSALRSDQESRSTSVDVLFCIYIYIKSAETVTSVNNLTCSSRQIYKLICEMLKFTWCRCWFASSTNWRPMFSVVFQNQQP